MNKQQRKEINNLQSQLESFEDWDSYQALVTGFEDKLKSSELAALAHALAGDIEVIRDELESQRSDEQDKYDNLPENFQNGERGESLQEGIDNLENAIDALDSAMRCLGDNVDEDWADSTQDYINDAVGYLGEF